LSEILPGLLMQISLMGAAWLDAYGVGIVVMETFDFSFWFEKEGKPHLQIYFSYVPLAMIARFPALRAQLPGLVDPPGQEKPQEYLRLAVMDQRGFVRGLLLSFVPTYAHCRKLIPDPLKNPATTAAVVDTATGQWVTLQLENQPRSR
jgi:hypothetical protein